MIEWTTARRHGHAVYLGSPTEQREKPVSVNRLLDLHATGQLGGQAAEMARELRAGGPASTSPAPPAAQDAPQACDPEPGGPGADVSLADRMRVLLRTHGLTPTDEAPEA